MPNKAEEGLTGLIQPKPPLTTEERISEDGNYPSDLTLNLVDHLAGEEELDFKDLDSEGRAMIVDVGLFVLINVYCPNTGGTDEREKFKRNYHKILEARVNALIKEGREVMVVGDLNACAAVQDHCEGSLLVSQGLAKGLQGEEGFWGVDCRRYFRDWLMDADGSGEGSGGCMVDIVRRFWPNRKGMYTCMYSLLPFNLFTYRLHFLGWNTKISARESNYGTRIDFILITPNLIPWIAAADIQPEIKGSDHCPVFVDFRDEITNANGITIKLQDVLGIQATLGAAKEPPRLVAKFWEEYSGKQTLLETFFGRQPANTQILDQPSTPIWVANTSVAAEPLARGQPSPVIEPPVLASSKSHDLTSSLSPSLSTTAPASPASKRKITAETSKSSKKLKPIPTLKTETTKSKEKTSGQPTIASFFSQPKATKSQITASPSTASVSNGKNKFIDTKPQADDDIKTPDGLTQDTDYRLALLLSSQGSTPSSSQGCPEKETKQAWNNLLAPIQPPKCVMHREPAKELTVNKHGPNKGKRFFICSR